MSDEINYNEVYEAQIHMAEIMWAYWKALVNAGFSPPDALKLTAEYQRTMLSNPPVYPVPGNQE